LFQLKSARGKCLDEYDRSAYKLSLKKIKTKPIKLEKTKKGNNLILIKSQTKPISID
jgi:hypothetical protein